MKREYFLGGNTTQGFFSYYEFLADGEKFNKIYIVKGGPGTGKSTAMKKVGKWGEDHGFDVDYVHCSSDPFSLDGVIIKEVGIAMVDGTAPHVVDVVNAGAVESLLNMGDFWDENALRKSKAEIIQCNKEISEHFTKTYNFLGAAGCLYKNCCIMPDKKSAVNVAMEIVANIPRAEKGAGKIRKLFSEAITPEGIISYADTLVCEKQVVLKSEIYGGSGMITEILKTKLSEQGYDIEVFYSPLNPEGEIRNIVVPEIGLSVITTDMMTIADEKRAMVIDVDEMVNAKVDSDFLRNKILVMTLLQQAVRTLAGAKRLHDKLESYYIPNINFDAAEKKVDAVLAEIEKFAQ
ncbi:MAG: hypothetical protein WCX81_03910 [Monoglobales bacterium]